MKNGDVLQCRASLKTDVFHSNRQSACWCPQFLPSYSVQCDVLMWVCCTFYLKREHLSLAGLWSLQEFVPAAEDDSVFLVYIALLLLALKGIKACFKGFNEEYLSRDSTLAIKGIFVILVFCRHYKQYVSLGDNLLDGLFIYVDGLLGQLIVVIFLFYSGYGIITQIKNSAGGVHRLFSQTQVFPSMD